MKLLLKILKPAAIAISGILIVLFISAILVQDKVADIILKSLSNDISTKFETGSVRLSFIKRFPKATLDLKNVLVHSSPGFDRACFSGIDTDTLLAAGSVMMEFRIMNIIKGNYTIERIGIKKGSLRILTDTSGMVNYEIRAVNPSDSDNDLVINLEGIHLNDVRAIYDNRATRLVVAGAMDNGSIKSKIAGADIDFTGKGDLNIDIFSLYDFKINKSINTRVHVNLNKSDKGVRFGKSTLSFDDNILSMNGFVSSENILDLAVKGENIDISGLKAYLPDKFLKKVTAYNPAGLLALEGTIKGKAARTVNPEINIVFSVKNGEVTYIPSSPAIQNVSFEGSFTNGTGRIPQTSSLKISNFRGKLGSSDYSGSLMLSDFSSFRCNLELKGTIIPAEIREFFNLKSVSVPEGSADMDLKVNGIIPRKQEYRISDLLALRNNTRLVFRSFGFGLGNGRIIIKNATGILTSNDADKITAKDLVFTYNGQQIKLNGTFDNLPEWLAGKAVTMKAAATVNADRIIAESFLPGSNSEKKDNLKKKPFNLPGDMIIDLDFNIGNLRIRNLNSRNVSGSMDYKPQMMNFKTLKLNSLDGIISGDCFLTQNPNRSFIFKGSFNLDKIDVKTAFSSFNNFGQNFITGDNLEGILSGSLTILVPMDQMLHPLIGSVTAEGKYILEKGALVNFEPVRELSRFIDISELENIRFSELANDFFIRNNALYIPQMDVRSSAADLSVNGRHDFNNEYEYHIRILLSEILSKKIRKPRPNTTEFGAVSDDGLGRTALLLKVEDAGNGLKVSYDVKAAGTRIRSEMKKERQSLKTILNEEYGWFKKDSTAGTKPAVSGTPRFRVTWDEIDSTKVRKETPPSEKNENMIRNIFKKRY